MVNLIDDYLLGVTDRAERIERKMKEVENKVERYKEIRKHIDEKRIIKEMELSHEFYKTHEVSIRTDHPDFKSDMMNHFKNNPSNIEPLLFTGAYEPFEWIEVTKKTQ